MSNIIPFQFENTEVRVIHENEEVLFCLKDVCEILNIANPRDLMSKQLDQKGVEKIYTLTSGGRQELAFINEPNLYRVIFRSNKAEAKHFQDWVFNEVLPSIRKTGGYVISPNQYGGILKGVVNKALLPIKQQFDEQIKALCEEIKFLKSSYDPSGVFVTDYKPMVETLKEMKIPPKGRRRLVYKCSHRCKRYLLSIGKGQWVRPSRETGRWLYHVDGVNEWLKHEGYGVIALHMDKLIGQGRLQLVSQA